MENFADIYTDYLISSVSYTTATGLGHLLSVKHPNFELQSGAQLLVESP